MLRPYAPAPIPSFYYLVFFAPGGRLGERSERGSGAGRAHRRTARAVRSSTPSAGLLGSRERGRGG
eukprot:2347231-Alexandrium_andersonii.AAC.1